MTGLNGEKRGLPPEVISSPETKDRIVAGNSLLQEVEADLRNINSRYKKGDRKGPADGEYVKYAEILAQSGLFDKAETFIREIKSEEIQSGIQNDVSLIRAVHEYPNESAMATFQEQERRALSDEYEDYKKGSRLEEVALAKVKVGLYESGLDTIRKDPLHEQNQFYEVSVLTAIAKDLISKSKKSEAVPVIQKIKKMAESGEHHAERLSEAGVLESQAGLNANATFNKAEKLVLSITCDSGYELKDPQNEIGRAKTDKARSMARIDIADDEIKAGLPKKALKCLNEVSDFYKFDYQSKPYCQVMAKYIQHLLRTDRTEVSHFFENLRKKHLLTNEMRQEIAATQAEEGLFDEALDTIKNIQGAFIGSLNQRLEAYKLVGAAAARLHNWDEINKIEQFINDEIQKLQMDKRLSPRVHDRGASVSIFIAKALAEAEGGIDPRNTFQQIEELCEEGGKIYKSERASDVRDAKLEAAALLLQNN